MAAEMADEKVDKKALGMVGDLDNPVVDEMVASRACTSAVQKVDYSAVSRASRWVVS